MRLGRPDWFYGFCEEAEQFAIRGQDHGLLEAELGMAREIDRGKIAAARQIYTSAQRQLISLRLSNGQGGETDSTQIAEMLVSRRYPKDVRLRIRSILSKSQTMK